MGVPLGSVFILIPAPQSSFPTVPSASEIANLTPSAQALSGELPVFVRVRPGRAARHASGCIWNTLQSADPYRPATYDTETIRSLVDAVEGAQDPGISLGVVLCMPAIGTTLFPMLPQTCQITSHLSTKLADLPARQRLIGAGLGVHSDTSSVVVVSYRTVRVGDQGPHTIGIRLYLGVTRVCSG